MLSLLRLRRRLCFDCATGLWIPAFAGMTVFEVVVGFLR
jgi:hypothetical protein